MIYDLSGNIFVYAGALIGRNPVKLRQHDNRLWAVCDDGALIFSNNGDASQWDPLNIILAPNHEHIIDFLPGQGGAILVTRTAVYAFYGSGSYLDTSIQLIEAGLLLADCAVVVDNVCFLLGNRGVHQVSLNGMKEIPHEQSEYFRANYKAWNAIRGAVQGVYLYRFHSILYLFQDGFGAMGFLFSIATGSFQKIDQNLPTDLPYMTDIYDSKVDFILGAGDGTTICRSNYPAGVLTTERISNIQTRHEDADSVRQKVWRHLGLDIGTAAANVSIQMFLDKSPVASPLFTEVFDLGEGDNVIELYSPTGNLYRSRTVSFLIGIGGHDYLITEQGEAITDEAGEILSVGIQDTPAHFAIREIRLKYREVGIPE